MALSFKNDILPLFTAQDIAHMKFKFDLSSRDDNEQNAQDILNSLQGIGGRIMPPPPAAPWSPANIALYKQWIDDGFAD